MIFLTTDPSLTAFGYAVVDGENPDGRLTVLHMGCIQTKAYPRKGGKVSTGLLKGQWENIRLRNICEELKDVCLTYKVETALYEDPAGSKNFNAIRALAEIKGLCIGLFTGMGIPYQAIRAKEVKKALTSDCNADKEQVEAVVCEHFPGIEDDLIARGLKSKVKKESIYDALGVYCTWTTLN